MKTSVNIKNQAQTFKLIALATLLTLGANTAHADFQLDVLLKPSEGVLVSEARGRVMIYDGLQEETVELALNQQFDRIENMMFVNTRYINEYGEEEVADDCD